MALTVISTDKVTGRITNVHVGYDATHGVNISSGILSFEYQRIHDAIRNQYPGAATSSTLNMQTPSHFTWKLRFLSDCRIAWFATDVQVADGNQYALVANGFSNKIEYLAVFMTIEDHLGVSRSRAYYLQNAYCLRNNAYIGDDEDSIYEYEGEAEYISYSDT